MDSRKVIFIVGSSRSGTTLMAHILNNHSEIYSFNELHFFERFWIPSHQLVDRVEGINILHRLFCSTRIHPYRDCPKNTFKDDIELLLKGKEFPIYGLELLSAFLFYETERNGKRIPCEQTPRNLFYLTYILDYFQNARIIYMIRDPRDVLLSQKFKWKRVFKSKKEPYPVSEAVRNWINYHPITISLLWKTSVKSILPFLSDKRILVVRFEDLINDPENVMKDVCKFLYINYENNMLDVPYAFSSIYKDEEKKGLDKRRSGNWRSKLSSTEIFITQKINNDIMEKFGYKKEKIQINPLLLSLYILSLMPKTLLAIIFNLKHNKNIFYSLYKRLFYLIK